jgi:hypothetical protein
MISFSPLLFGQQLRMGSLTADYFAEKENSKIAHQLFWVIEFEGND